MAFQDRWSGQRHRRHRRRGCLHRIDRFQRGLPFAFRRQETLVLPNRGPVEASPLVLDGRVFIGDTLTNFFALDAKTGAKLWSRGFDDKIKSSANWISGTNGTSTNILVGGYDFRLYSLEATTGKSNWVYETGNYINGSPAISRGRTAFGGCDAIVHVVDVIGGKKLREIEAGAYIAASGAMEGNLLYVGHYENELLCVDVDAGKILWKYRDRAFPFMSSPAVTADRVLVGSRDKRLHCIQRADGKPVWTFQTRGKVESSPVVVGDRVLVGSDDGRLYIVSLADGKERWNYELGQPIQSSPPWSMATSSSAVTTVSSTASDHRIDRWPAGSPSQGIP